MEQNIHKVTCNAHYKIFKNLHTALQCEIPDFRLHRGIRYVLRIIFEKYQMNMKFIVYQYHKFGTYALCATHIRQTYTVQVK
jgi:hypothetical protein